MAAPKYNFNVALKKSEQKKDNSPNPEQTNSAQDKIIIQNYREKLASLLKDPANVKKATLIIEKWLNSKK